jgi:hypothetical protein
VRAAKQHELNKASQLKQRNLFGAIETEPIFCRFCQRRLTFKHKHLYCLTCDEYFDIQLDKIKNFKEEIKMRSPTSVTTGRVRFSFVKVFKPDDITGKYSITLLIPKSDKATLGKIKAAMAAAKTLWLDKNTGKKLPSDLKHTLHDGDGERPNGGDFGPECKDCWVLTVSSNSKPTVVFSDKSDILDSQELYSGCYGRAVINFYVYDTQGNKGLTAGLNGVMKLSDGEPLSGGVVTDEDWDDGWEDSALPATGTDGFMD